MIYNEEIKIEIPDCCWIDEEWMKCAYNKSYRFGYELMCTGVPSSDVTDEPVVVGVFEGEEPEIAFREMLVRQGGFRTPEGVITDYKCFYAIEVRKTKWWRVFLTQAEVFEIKADNPYKAYAKIMGKCGLRDSIGDPDHAKIRDRYIEAFWPKVGDHGTYLTACRLSPDTDIELEAEQREKGAFRCDQCDAIHGGDRYPDDSPDCRVPFVRENDTPGVDSLKICWKCDIGREDTQPADSILDMYDHWHHDEDYEPTLERPTATN